MELDLNTIEPILVSAVKAEAQFRNWAPTKPKPNVGLSTPKKTVCSDGLLRPTAEETSFIEDFTSSDSESEEEIHLLFGLQELQEENGGL